MLRTPAASRRLLEAAGYVWDKDQEVWVHPKTQRQLDGNMPSSMTTEQIETWIRAGEKKKP
jgi:hypothetical protein